MTEAKVVYTGVSHGAGALHGDLFAGMKFWLTVKLPARSRFVDLVTVNNILFDRHFTFCTETNWTIEQWRRKCPIRTTGRLQDSRSSD
jgi:hypothetical protein